MTFGTATGEGKILTFNLSDDAKEPSQICKLAKAYLKGHKELKYRKLRVIAGGQTFEEDMEEEGGSRAECGRCRSADENAIPGKLGVCRSR